MSLNITQHVDKIVINCTHCTLSNCISAKNNAKTISIVHHSSYLMVPVTLNPSWFDDYGLKALRDTSALRLHGRRFVVCLVLGIVTFITLLPFPFRL